MKSSSLIVTVILTAFAAQTSQAGAPVNRARAAELGLHRLENLVILKKVQPTHLARLKSLALSVLPHTTDDEAAYQVVASQYPAADGTQSSVSIPMKIDGKALKQTETLGSEPVVAPTWPNLDAVTLAENALHCIQGEKLDNNRPDLCVSPEITSFAEGFSSLALSQEAGSAGPIAVIDLKAFTDQAGASRTLRIRLKADGIPTDDSPISFLQE